MILKILPNFCLVQCAVLLIGESRSDVENQITYSFRKTQHTFLDLHTKPVELKNKDRGTKLTFPLFQ